MITGGYEEVMNDDAVPTPSSLTEILTDSGIVVVSTDKNEQQGKYLDIDPQEARRRRRWVLTGNIRDLFCRVVVVVRVGLLSGHELYAESFLFLH